MTTLAYSQQQLLNVLQITPLQLAATFNDESTPNKHSAAEPGSDVQMLDAVQLSSVFAQDIQLVVPEAVSWFAGAHISNPALNDNQLITPLLSQLQQAEQKKALWQLLSARYED